MKIRFHPEAEFEIDDAVAYYNLQREGLGRDFAREVQAGLDRIAEFPHAWRPLGRGIRRYRLTRFPYGIVYASLPKEIFVLAVMHLHREPEYWRNRIPE